MLTPTTITDPATLLRISQLQGQIVALQDAIASGVTRVSYDGKSVEYADMNALKMAINYTTNTLNALLQPGYRKATVGVARFNKGYRPNQYRNGPGRDI
jgi:hypothetical protein